MNYYFQLVMAEAPFTKKQKRAWRKHKDEGSTEKQEANNVEEIPKLPPGVEMVEIDGSLLEGGGQVLRNAVTLSCLLGKPVHISKIRAGRTKPGLRPQHLTGIQLIGELCQGSLVGGHVGSRDISFYPGPLKGGHYTADTKTAGSICLLIQAALPCLMFAPAATRVIMKGGTNADKAPPIDYLLKVFKPMINKKCSLQFDCILNRRGFFPKGGGQVTLNSEPIKMLPAFEIMDRGDIVRVEIEAFTAGVVSDKVGRVMCSAAERGIRERVGGGVVIESGCVHLTSGEAIASGSGIMLTAYCASGCVFGGSGIGDRTTPPEETGRLAAIELLTSVTNNRTCVDEYLQDQLIIFMALAEGVSRVRCGQLTLHTRTAICVAEAMTGVHFEVKEISENENVIECKGMGLGK